MSGVWDWLQGDKGSLLAAGFMGSVVSAAMEWNGVLPSLRKIIVGTLSAYHLAPLAVPMLSWILDGIHVPPDKADGISGFLMGVVGIVVIEIILKAFNLRRDSLTKAGTTSIVIPPLKQEETPP